MTDVITGGATYADLLGEPLNYLELLHRPAPAGA
jgi:hypothetical protein